ncbi:MAG: hypothetical protein WKF47_15140 [Geodermatophilaceae bacterium]
MDWYAVHARDLPWRRPGTSPWAVLVSESMLQQTPVARVLPVWTEWLRRWPGPAALAAAPAGDAVRAWGRLGYPRRALRLHESARIVTDRYAGRVPDDLTDLLALPGRGRLHRPCGGLLRLRPAGGRRGHERPAVRRAGLLRAGSRRPGIDGTRQCGGRTAAARAAGGGGKRSRWP